MRKVRSASTSDSCKASHWAPRQSIYTTRKKERNKNIVVTYQWTKTPPPASSPSCMNLLQDSKCSSRFSSSISSTSTTLWAKFSKSFSSSGSFSTESTWVMPAAFSASLRRKLNNLPVIRFEKWRMTVRKAAAQTNPPM